MAKQTLLTETPTEHPSDKAGCSAAPCSRLYGVIYADPPWAYNESGGGDIRTPHSQYPTMQQDELLNMVIPADDNCILYLWATSIKLPEALEVMNGWGFRYKTQAVWDKVKVGMGYWFRGQHEILMVGTRGKVSPPPQSARVSSVIRCPRGRHSAKPEHVREWIGEWYPDVPKLEIFGRLKRPGWDVFGNQVEHDLFSENAESQPPR